MKREKDGKQEVSHSFVKAEQEGKRKSWHRKQKQKFALICVSVIFIIFASLYFDNTLIRYVSLLRNSVLNAFFLGVNFIDAEIIIALALTSLFLWQEHRRKWIVPLWLSFGISAIVGFILKLTIQRPRPFQSGLISLLPGLTETGFSFPSGHALLAFCAIPILSEKYPKLKKVWIGIAIIIALSRVYLGFHFLSDVIAGAFIGYLIGFMIVKVEKETKFGRNIYERIFGR
jgi:undecaprenyl-diphosphatase